MIIEIKIENRLIRLLLKKGKQILDETSIVEEHSLSEKLLPEIDKLLKRNKLKPENIKIILKADIKESFTTYRIAKAVADSWNWALKNSEPVDNWGVKKP